MTIHRHSRYVTVNQALPNSEEESATSFRIEGPYVLRVVGVKPHCALLTLASKDDAIILRNWLNEQIDNWDDSKHHIS